jgi:hypothetical protein
MSTRYLPTTLMVAAERPGFSRRLAALANATGIGVGSDSKTQKTPDLTRRKAVGCNPMLDGGFYPALLCNI